MLSERSTITQPPPAFLLSSPEHSGTSRNTLPIGGVASGRVCDQWGLSRLVFVQTHLFFCPRVKFGRKKMPNNAIFGQKGCMFAIKCQKLRLTQEQLCCPTSQPPNSLESGHFCWFFLPIACGIISSDSETPLLCH